MALAIVFDAGYYLDYGVDAVDLESWIKGGTMGREKAKGERETWPACSDTIGAKAGSLQYYGNG